jgi:predicted dehydrogenase
VIQEKLLGNVIEAEFHFDRFKEEVSPKLHKEVPGPGTGSLYDLGSHLIDQALQLFGDPIEIFADIQIMRPVSKVDDYFEVVLYYPGMRVRLKSSYQVREPLPGYVIHGSKGSFIKPKTDVQEAMLQAGKVPGQPDWGTESETEKGLLHTEINGKVIREYVPSLKGNYLEYYEGIYKAIRNNEPLPVSAEDGLKVVRVIETAYDSNSKKKVMPFKP